MIKCSACNEEKEDNEFSFRNKAKGLRQSKCKLCVRLYGKKHYTDNKNVYVKRAVKQNKAYAEKNKLYVLEYLKQNPCVDCGEPDIEVLQFDHIEMIKDIGGKRISNFLHCSLRKLQEEIDKCEVRCANCHVRRTRKQMGWERDLMGH